MIYKRILVCSDIHGEIDKFQSVLEDASYNPKDDLLILLGDYIDRGSDSKQTVEFVMKLVREGAIALKGNHEEMFLHALEEEEEWHNWLFHVGYLTYESYNGDIDLMRVHAEWMKRNLKRYYETDDYIFVHAGLAPETPLEWQDEYDCLWSRHYEQIGLGKLVIHGHTPVEEVTQYQDQLFIDTGAVFGGKLTLLELPSMKTFEM